MIMRNKADLHAMTVSLGLRQHMEIMLADHLRSIS